MKFVTRQRTIVGGTCSYLVATVFRFNLTRNVISNHNGYYYLRLVYVSFPSVYGMSHKIFTSVNGSLHSGECKCLNYRVPPRFTPHPGVRLSPSREQIIRRRYPDNAIGPFGSRGRSDLDRTTITKPMCCRVPNTRI